MTNTTEPLDFQIKLSKIDGDFEVWTPDTSGAIIGIGNTREEAFKNAIATLGYTVAEIAKLIA